jgi:(2Fe-2S) ferredoxin
MDGDDGRPGPWRVHLCLGPHCSARGSRALLPVLEDEVRRAGLADRVEVIGATCRDRCDFGPNANVYPGPTMYNGLDDEAVRRVVREHLADGRPVLALTRLPAPVRREGVRRPRGAYWRDR